MRRVLTAAAALALGCIPPVQTGVNPIDGCTVDTDCPTGYHCAPGVGDALTGNACQLFPRPCRVDAQCDTGQSCQSGSCLPANRAFCQPCGTSADCAAGGLCVTSSAQVDQGGYCSESCDQCPSSSYCLPTTNSAGDAGRTCLPTADSCNASGQSPVPTLTFINENVFEPVCTVCHSAGAGPAFGNVDLATNPYVALLGSNGTGAPASNVLGSATGLLRVDPGNPGQSLLWIKLAQLGTTAEYGEAMPPPDGGLAAVLLQAVGGWIDAGAPND